MHDFGKFCYLDVQKTGSTFISRFLKRHAAIPLVAYEKHRRVHLKEQLADGKFFFISVREPLDCYKSLYSYGVKKRGAAFQNISSAHADAAKFYDGTPEGFSNWLRFLLDPQNGAIFGLRPEHEAKLFGVMTFRFLSLSFFRPARILADAADLTGLIGHYEKSRLHSAIVKNETLNHDLAALVEGPLRPFIKQPQKAAAELRSTGKKINESGRPDAIGDFVLEGDLLERLYEREKFLYDVIGYPRPPAGVPQTALPA